MVWIKCIRRLFSVQQPKGSRGEAMHKAARLSLFPSYLLHPLICKLYHYPARKLFGSKTVLQGVPLAPLPILLEKRNCVFEGHKPYVLGDTVQPCKGSGQEIVVTLPLPRECK